MKEKIIEYYDDYLSFDEGTNELYTIDSIIKDLKVMKKLGLTHIQFFANNYQDGSSVDVDMKPYKYRDETDKEMNARLEYEKYVLKRKELRDREQYEKLKSKFETKTN